MQWWRPNFGWAIELKYRAKAMHYDKLITWADISCTLISQITYNSFWSFSQWSWIRYFLSNPKMANTIIRLLLILPFFIALGITLLYFLLHSCLSKIQEETTTEWLSFSDWRDRFLNWVTHCRALHTSSFVFNVTNLVAIFFRATARPSGHNEIS